MFLLAATTLFPTSLRHTSSPVYHDASRTLLLSLDSFTVPISILWALQPTKRLSPAVLTITVSVLTQLLGALKNFPGPVGALSELLVQLEQVCESIRVRTAGSWGVVESGFEAGAVGQAQGGERSNIGRGFLDRI